MVIDTSALVAILRDEAERRAFIDAIDAAEVRLISAATFVEISIVIEARLGADGARALDQFLSRAAIEIVPVDLAQAQSARDAYVRFGRGRHRAGLNYGDCFAYALASARGEPLLFKGDDFVHTDVAAVLGG